jgi:hypothetical protein
MEKSNHSSFLKSLALAFGDGLLFSVAMKMAHGPSKTREDEMTDLGPLAERLRNVEDHTQTIDKDALVKFGEGLDGRVLEKVIVALEARLTEHVGQVDRRLAEIDAQVALDLKAVDTHTAAQTNAVEKAIQQIEAQVRDYVEAAQQASAEQIFGVDQKLSALQDALPAKFREIIEAVRQSMEARVALELTELENRVSSRTVSSEQLQELQTSLRGEVETLSGRLTAEMRDLAEHQQSQTAPLHQALQQLETKLTTLREELPPKIRQIVEAVEASMDARISAGDQQAAGRMGSLEQAVAALRAEMPSAGGFQQAIEENLRRHAAQVAALDEKLTVVQEELPPKIKAIVDAVRESLDARMAVELQGIEERHGAQIQQAEARVSQAQERFREQLAAESKTPALEQSVAKLQADLDAMNTRAETGSLEVTDRLSGLEQHAAQISAGMAAELESLQTQHRAEIERLEARLRAERETENVPGQIDAAVAGLRETLESKLAAEIHEVEAQLRAEREKENVPGQIDTAVAGLRESLEVKLAAEMHGLEGRSADHSPDLEKALQYASLLEARVQAMEQKLQRSGEETVERAVERVWQALESRLQQRQAQAPVMVQPAETISGLRQKSTSAEQSVLDLIAGIGQLFEKPAPRVTHAAPVHAAPPEAALPPVHNEPAVAAAHVEPAPAAAAPAAEPVAGIHAVEPAATPAPAPPPAVEVHIEAEPEAPAAAPEPVTAKEPEVAAELAAPPAAPVPLGPVAVPAAAAVDSAEILEPKLEEKPPVILFKPKDSGRKWRIPFVSSFLLVVAALAWLQF